MSKVSRELWEEFHEAFLSAPGTVPYDDDQYWENDGSIASIKNSLDKCINFWMNNDVLMKYGYIAEVSDETLEKIEEYQSKLKIAKKKIIREVFEE